MDQEKIEECVDELYALNKLTGDRLIDFTEENKLILEKLERNTRRYTKDIRNYSINFFWVVVILTMLNIAGLLWLYNDFEDRFDRKVYLLNYLVSREEDAVVEQNSLLKILQDPEQKELKKLGLKNKEEAVKKNGIKKRD
jgi:hypothetical protein